MGRKKRSRARQTRTSCTKIHDLPDDLLELVLRRIRWSVFLVRAAATCKLWRRVLAGAAADSDFLCRHHPAPPHVLGHYYEGRSGATVFVPASPAQAPVKVSLHFLACQYYGRLTLSDCRGCLLAFVNSDDSSIVVCNPLTRKHRQLYPRRYGYSFCTIGAFLLSGDTTDASSIDMSCFRVLCVWLDMDCDTGTKTARAEVFSARDGRWVLLGKADVGSIMPSHSCRLDASTKFLGRAGGSLCWSGEVNDAVLHLDERSGVFSIITLPAANRRSMSYHRGNLRVVRGTGRSVRLARIVGDDVELILWWSRHGGGQCVVLMKVCLSQLVGIEEVKLDWSWRFLDTAETVTPVQVVLLPNEEYMWMFSVDVETMEMKRLHKKNCHARRVFSYELPWPPTIKVCV